MAKTLNRKFVASQQIYVVDRWTTVKGIQASETVAEIVEVENNTFVALLYGDTHKKYSFNDYGRLIFDTKLEAAEAAAKLPKPGSTVWLISENSTISKTTVTDIGETYCNDCLNLTVKLENHEPIPVDMIGIKLFLSEVSVIKKIMCIF